MEPRKHSKKLVYRGIYKGAKVVRGIDWQWGDQDKNCTKGKVIEVQNWNKDSFYSAVFVEWENGIRNLYRMGYKGMV